MLAVVFLFFGVIIAVNVVLAVAASGTFPGLVVRNSYVASQGYNQLLTSARVQTEAGWRLELEAADGLLNVRLANRDGRVEHYLVVTALAGRPSSSREDRTIEFSDGADGYRAAEALSPGLWEIDVEARRGGELVFRETRRAYVRPGESG
jgi:nitrogen fixation protein FixH